MQLTVKKEAFAADNFAHLQWETYRLDEIQLPKKKSPRRIYIHTNVSIIYLAGSYYGTYILI